MIRNTVLFTLFLIAGAGVVAAESVELLLHIQGKEFAAPPEVFSNYIIFYYKATGHVYNVSARFSHENYKALHVFRKNENNLFVLAIPAPDESMLIKYRLVVDGVWMHDPANPLTEKDAPGTVFSLLPFEKTSPSPIESPLLAGNGYVEFSIRAERGATVSIAGDFNAYDPFSHRLTETSPGIYKIRHRFLPGKHYYYFVVNGVRMIDPRNEAMVVDADRQRLSVVVVP